MTETASVRAPGSGTRTGSGGGTGARADGKAGADGAGGRGAPAAEPLPPPSGPPHGPEAADPVADPVADPAADPETDGPAAAFDLLYTRHADPLFRQAYLLTGDRDLAERAVAHAFRRAWERWPEVAVDPDPAGWVRAAAHDYALAPWHRLLPRLRTPPRRGTSGPDLLLEALLRLPPVYRRTLLLHDGLGLDLPETAAECEASTAAAAGRLMHAREGLAEYVPGLTRVAPERRRKMVRGLLEGTAAAGPAPRTVPARAVRGMSEGRVRLRTGAAVGLTALLAVAVGLTAAAGPQGYTAPGRAPAVSVHSPDGGGTADGG